MAKKISVVIPAYNEHSNIPVIYNAVHAVLSESPYSFDIIFVNDGSTDNTLEVLKELSKTAPNLYFIDLSRNFGHQLALKAGYDLATGDCVISMDCDMQHPPELITEMIRKWEEGYDVVYTVRQDDPKLSNTKRQSSSSFYKFLNRMSDIEIEAGTADFRLLSSAVLNVFKNFHENEPFLRGLVKWVGFKQYAINYVPGDRHSGESKYTLKKMVRFALHGITSFSIKPLYSAIYLGFTFSLLSVLYLPFIAYAWYTDQKVEGWTSVIVTVVFFGGLQLIILGIIGIYVGKMFMQVKNRPNYIVGSTNLPA